MRRSKVGILAPIAAVIIFFAKGFNPLQKI